MCKYGEWAASLECPFSSGMAVPAWVALAQVSLMVTGRAFSLEGDCPGCLDRGKEMVMDQNIPLARGKEGSREARALRV